MHRTFILLTIIFYSNKIYSQDLHIYYNVFKDSIWMQKNGKETTARKTKIGETIQLHLIEYNNYIYQAKINVTTKSQTTESPLLRSHFNSNENSEPQNNSINNWPTLSFTSNNLFGDLLSSFTNPNSDHGSRGNITGSPNSNINFLEIIEYCRTVNNNIIKINQLISILQMLDQCSIYYHSIHHNRQLPPTILKQHFLSTFENAVNSKNKPINTSELFHLNLEIASINTLIVESLKLIDLINDAYNNIQQDKNIIYTPTYLEIESELSLTFKQLYKNSIFLESAKNLVISKEPVNMTSMYLKYLEMLSNSFEKTIPISVESENISIQIALFENDSITSYQFASTDKNSIQSKEITFQSSSAFNFNTSFGLALNNFQKIPEKYYIENYVIKSEQLNKLNPIIYSSLNITTNSKSLIKPSLSLGIGTSLSNDEATNGLIYILGLGAIIGRKNQLQLSGGLTYYNTEKLSKGLKPNQPIDIGQGELPTVKKYENGFFIGLSFMMK